MLPLFDIIGLPLLWDGVAMYLSSVESFLLGYKPSCYENLTAVAADKLYKLFSYPLYREAEDFAMFFQNEWERDLFLSSVEGVDRSSPQYIRMLGTALGYPPKAVDFFTDYRARRLVDLEEATNYFSSVQVVVVYCGLHFMSHVEDLEDNVKWLWDRYRFKNPIHFKRLFPPSGEFVKLDVPYRDQTQLTKAAHDFRAWLQPSTYISKITI